MFSVLGPYYFWGYVNFLQYIYITRFNRAWSLFVSCGKRFVPLWLRARGAEFVEYEVSGSSSSLRDFGVSARECECDSYSWYASEFHIKCLIIYICVYEYLSIYPYVHLPTSTLNIYIKYVHVHIYACIGVYIYIHCTYVWRASSHHKVGRIPLWGDKGDDVSRARIAATLVWKSKAPGFWQHRST